MMTVIEDPKPGVRVVTADGIMIEVHGDRRPTDDELRRLFDSAIRKIRYVRRQRQHEGEELPK